MNQKEILEKLYPLLVDGIKNGKFKYLKSKQMLQQKTDYGKLEIKAFVDFNANSYELNVSISLRIDLVENIMQQFWDMNPLYLKETITYATEVGLFQRNPDFRYTGVTIDDIIPISEKIAEFLNCEGLEHLDYYSDIHHLEDLYNNNRDNVYLIYKADFNKVFYGLILAFLVGRKDIRELIDKYKIVMANSNDSQYYPERFNKLTDYINKNIPKLM